MVWKSKVWLILFVLCVYNGLAQNRYAIYLKDKNNTSFLASNPIQFLSQRAIDRRVKHNVLVTEQDFPVNSNYKQTIANTGAKVLFTSRWLNVIIAEATLTQITEINNLSFVQKSILVAPGLQPTQPDVSNGGIKLNMRIKSGTATQNQLNMLGIPQMHSNNYKGNGVLIAILDSGFPGVNTLSPFAHIQAKLVDQYNFVNRDDDAFVNDSHGTEVLSIIAALKGDEFVGAAPEASFCLYVTEHVPDEYRIEEFQWLCAAERADSTGADILNASLGYNTFDDASMDYVKSQLDGQTAIVTKAAAIASSKGIAVVVSAGNEGNNSWQTITPPADAEDIFAVGSVTATGVKSSFSSFGPTADNRIKPDLVAMGSSTAAIGTNGNVRFVSGTSEATPLISSLLAGLIQQFPDKKVSELREVILQTSSQAAEPDNSLGYGIPNYERIVNYINFPVGVEEINHPYIFFPNPLNQKLLLIKEKNDLHFTLEAIEVIDAHGKNIKTWKPLLTDKVIQYEIDLNDLQKGNYLLKVKTQSSYFTHKIIIP